MSETNDTDSILDAGISLAGPRSPVDNIDTTQGIPFVMAPAGYTVNDLERLLPTPIRHRAAVSVSDSESFIKYLKKHGSLAECCIYADIDAETEDKEIEVEDE